MSIIMYGSNVKVYYDLTAKNKLKELLTKTNSVFILCDSHTEKYCLPFLFAQIPALQNAFILIIPSGEKSKDWKIAMQLCEVLVEEYANRDALLINVGGGVVCDLGGFVASIFKRGISFIHIPTSLLAQVDAAIGGKTAINLKGAKNQVGTFYMPKAVFVFNDLLITLPFRHCVAGFAEMLKHGLIADENYWNELKKIKYNKKGIMNSTLIEKSINIKKSIVNVDFKENNERKKLNFGHTIGHAFESYFMQQKIPILHGEAIAWGILVEAHISWQKGLLLKDELEEIQSVIQLVYKMLNFSSLDLNRLKTFFFMDKKRDNNLVNMTLLKKIGTAVSDQYCSDFELENALLYLKNLDS